MKFFKCILILFISASITSCGDDSSEPPFVLSNANIAGNYNMSSFNTDVDLSTEVTPGVKATFSTIKLVGDIFQVDFVLTSNGSYTASGQYSVTSTVTATGSSPVTNQSIINFSDSGTFNVNTANNTITFNSSNGDFLGSDFIKNNFNVNIFNNNTFNITVFNENGFKVAQEVEEVVNPIITEVSAVIGFVKK